MRDKKTPLLGGDLKDKLHNRRIGSLTSTLGVLLRRTLMKGTQQIHETGTTL